jgi:hypothetical protein
MNQSLRARITRFRAGKLSQLSSLQREPGTPEESAELVELGKSALLVSGSLVGAMDGLGNHDDKPRAPERRPSGVMLSMLIASPVNEKRVIATLRAEGAADIELAHGEWRDGDWADFNPVAARDWWKGVQLILQTGGISCRSEKDPASRSSAAISRHWWMTGRRMDR